MLAGIAAISQLSGSSPANALGTNPYLDPGTVLSGKPAPGFTLSDESGRPISLSAYRGKVVFLDFNDSECTTICPLTTTAMRDAQRMLGPAGSRVQLLGIDANPKATSIADVLSYSQLHGMLGRWHFLTGSLPQLRRVWGDYHVQADIERGLIEHTPALYVIDPQGRLRRVYVTQQSYSAVGQLGQLLAQEASRLLPGHPKVDANASYAQVPTISPAQTTTVPKAGGGRVSLGAGQPRLYLFFATWDREVTSLSGQLQALNRYAAQSHRAKLPALTAVDEGSVEPSPGALTSMLGSLPRPLSYPVGIDTSGRVADGYEVEGQPWFVLTSATGKILWYWNVDTQGWLSTAKLDAQVRAALSKAPAAPTGTAAVSQALAGLTGSAGRTAPAGQPAARVRRRPHRADPRSAGLSDRRQCLGILVRGLQERVQPVPLGRGPVRARRGLPGRRQRRTTRATPRRSWASIHSAIPATRPPTASSRPCSPAACRASPPPSSSTVTARWPTSTTANTRRRAASTATSTPTPADSPARALVDPRDDS